MKALLGGNEMNSKQLILGKEFLNTTYSFYTGISTVVSNRIMEGGCKQNCIRLILNLFYLILHFPCNS